MVGPLPGLTRERSIDLLRSDYGYAIDAVFTSRLVATVFGRYEVIRPELQIRYPGPRSSCVATAMMTRLTPAISTTVGICQSTSTPMTVAVAGKSADSSA
jgi:hypothetical protein